MAWARHGRFVAPASTGTNTQESIELNWGATSSGILFPFLALGGAIRAYAGEATLGSGTSTAVTGIGFRPNLILFASNEHASEFGSTPGGIAVNITMSYGAWAGANQFAISTRALYLGGDVCKKRMTASYCLELFDGSGPTWRLAGSTMDSDGFTVTHASGLSGKPFGYLAIQCDGAPTVGTGTQSTTGFNVGFRPCGLLFMSSAVTSLDSSQADWNMGMGVASDSAVASSSNPWCVQFVRKDTSASNARATVNSTGVLSFSDDSGGWSEVARATLSSWDNTGFTLSWPVDDSAGRYFGYVAFRKTQPDSGNQPVALISPQMAEVTSAGTTQSVNGRQTLGLASAPGERVAIGQVDERNSQIAQISSAKAGMTTYFVGAQYHYQLGSEGAYEPAFVPQIYRYSVDGNR